MRTAILSSCVLAAALILSAPASAEAPAVASDPEKNMGADHLAKANKLVDGGIRWLLAHREDDGGWSLGEGAAKPAVTAMVLKALLQQPAYTVKSPEVAKGFEVLLKYQQKDGGIYDPVQGQSNYTTAVAVMALAEANSPAFARPLEKAIAYLKGLQIAPGSESPDADKIDSDHPFMGGVSYGQHGRPDLSNLGMWMEALHDAGIDPNDPAMKRALVFVTRTQNLSETNPRPWAKIGVSDGGFIYAPAVRGDLTTGESKAGTGPGGKGLRSYGSMTYVGFKSLLYSGVSRDDPRVQAAFQWIRRYWRLDSNPNMPSVQSDEGLFYYYHAFAKALRAWGEPVITDTKGGKHNWRQELVDQLGSMAKDDGHWENDAPRWFEKMPVLATTYAVLSLQEALDR